MNQFRKFPYLTSNMATAYDPDLDPTTLNEPGDDGGYDDGDTTTYGTPLITYTSTTRFDPDEEETSFGGGDETRRPLLVKKVGEMEIEQDKAWARIKSKFPKVDTSKLKASINEAGHVIVELFRKNSRPYTLLAKDDEVNEKLPPTIKNSLGPRAEEIVEANDGEIAKKKGLLTKMKDKLKFHRDKPLKTPEESSQIETLEREIGEQEEEIANMEGENEEIQEQMSLRDRVKAIFKKYGFTVFAVMSAVGVVTGVIVSNLSKGLSRLGKGVGDGLKTLGKKLGELLPGMVGAIVSFIFKTAGEVISFLGKHAWLLIMAIVLWFIEELKKKRK